VERSCAIIRKVGGVYVVKDRIISKLSHLVVEEMERQAVIDGIFC